MRWRARRRWTPEADAFNQILSQDAATAGTRTYTYDGLGRVIRPNFAYTGVGNTLAADGTARYVRDPGDDLFAVRNGTSTRLAWTDLHDDVVGQLTSTATTLDGSTTYDPLGKVLVTTGMWGSLGYQSEWTDEFTGRVNMMARWYNTDTGQFDTRDTATVSPTPDSVAANRFAYGDDNPLTTTDPTGHWGLKSFVKKATSAVTRTVSKATSTVSRAYNAATTTVKKAATTAKQTAKRAATAAKKTVKKAHSAVKKVAKKAVKAAKKAVNKGRKYVSNKAHQLKQKVKQAANKVKQAGKKAVAKAVRTVKKAATVVKDAAKATGKWVKEHKDTLIEIAAIGAGILAGLACTAATAGAGAVACMVGAAALVNVAKDYAQGDINSVGDLLTSAGTGGVPRSARWRWRGDRRPDRRCRGGQAGRRRRVAGRSGPDRWRGGRCRGRGDPVRHHGPGELDRCGHVGRHGRGVGRSRARRACARRGRASWWRRGGRTWPGFGWGDELPEAQFQPRHQGVDGGWVE
ncbi:RHS repeat-associated core domain-containing protein [Phytohabitans kaempferiae]|uniref:RHS repeat-associated core domain-containing protein n=1 Tax=Phytohabitans kaempferiae TaxID=1620943 RepID=A0ABV6LWZ2_9ACTN